MPPVTEIRRVLLPVAVAMYTVCAVVLDAWKNNPGQLWQITAWSAVVSVATAIAVYVPPSVWAKTVLAVIGVLAQVVATAVTDGRITTAEALTILMQLSAFVGAAGMTNRPPAPVSSATSVESHPITG